MRSLRVVTLNLWNDRGEVMARLATAIDGLRALAPDVVALQEVCAPAGPDNQAALLARELDMKWAFDAVDPDRQGGPVGNAILTRFPVREAQVPDARHLSTFQKLEALGDARLSDIGRSGLPHNLLRDIRALYPGDGLSLHRAIERAVAELLHYRNGTH